MGFSGKVLGDLVLFLVFIQAFILLCVEEQVLLSTRLLGAIEDESEKLQYSLVQTNAMLEQYKSAYQVLECAEQAALTEPNFV